MVLHDNDHLTKNVFIFNIFVITFAKNNSSQRDIFCGKIQYMLFPINMFMLQKYLLIILK